MTAISRSDRIALIIIAFFGIIHASVSFPNHFLFRTYALDLGLYTHVMWHYAHGSLHDSSLFLEVRQPMLADHFDLYLPLFSPLIYVFGSWTLLLIQWLAILIGAWGVYRSLGVLGLSTALACTGLVFFLLFFGIFAATAFDYHSNVIAAMALPWYIYHLTKGATLKAALVFLFMLIGKENMGFWLGPVAWILATLPDLTAVLKRWSVILGIGGLVWSIVVVGWVMPALSSGATYAHFDYGILGTGLTDAVGALIRQPVKLAQALFVDHIGVMNGSAIKLEFWWMLMLAGGWAFLFQPRWGLMALPLIAQKMWHDDPGKWSVIAQYGVEFAPLIAIAVPLSFQRLETHERHKLGVIIAMVFALMTTVHFMDRTVAYHDRSRIRIYQAQHWLKPYDLDPVRQAIALIPSEAAVSAQSPAVPHLALCMRLYQFPLINDARYILLMPQESPYPLETGSYEFKKRDLLNDTVWKPLIVRDEVILFERLTHAPVAAP